MNDHYPTGPQPWNPAYEAWPGGPPPGAIVAMLEEKRLRGEAEIAAAHAAAAAQARSARHQLLLLR